MVPLGHLHVGVGLVGRGLLPTTMLAGAIHQFLFGFETEGVLLSQFVLHGLGEVEAELGRCIRFFFIRSLILVTINKTNTHHQNTLHTSSVLSLLPIAKHPSLITSIQVIRSPLV